MSMSTAEETYSIVCFVSSVIGGQCWPQLLVTANWHIQFDARNDFCNLPDTTASEDVRDFVQ